MAWTAWATSSPQAPHRQVESTKGVFGRPSSRLPCSDADASDHARECRRLSMLRSSRSAGCGTSSTDAERLDQDAPGRGGQHAGGGVVPLRASRRRSASNGETVTITGSGATSDDGKASTDAPRHPEARRRSSTGSSTASMYVDADALARAGSSELPGGQALAQHRPRRARRRRLRRAVESGASAAARARASSSSTASRVIPRTSAPRP